MKKLIVTLSIFMMLLSMAACGSSTASTSTTTSTTTPPTQKEVETLQEPLDPPEEKPLVGQVTSIDESTITVVLGEYSMPDGFDRKMPLDGEPPQDKPDGEFKEGDTPPDRPEGEPEKEGIDKRPEGEPDSMKEHPGKSEGSLKDLFSPSDSTIIYDISEAEIMIRTTEGVIPGTIDDIPLNALINYTLNEDGTMGSITVLDF